MHFGKKKSRRRDITPKKPKKTVNSKETFIFIFTRATKIKKNPNELPNSNMNQRSPC